MLMELAYEGVAYGCEVVKLDPVSGMHIRPPRTKFDDGEPGTLMMLALAGSWMHSGLPSVRVTQAALPALMSAVPKRRPESPWRAWVIVLPDGQTDVSLLQRDGTPDAVRAVLTVNMGDQWCYFGLAGRVEYSEVGRTTEQLAELDWTDGLPSGLDTILLETTVHDRAAIRKMRRMILNTPLALEELDGVRRIGMERGARDRGRLPAGDYVIEAYEQRAGR
jgi:hypothetical protein